MFLCLKEVKKQKIGRILSKYSLFYRKVWKITSIIPSGETRSYQWVAEKIGNPEAVRAVGQALSENPLPGVIPCHRVIKKDGRPGGFSKGIEVKVRLLRKEGVEVKGSKIFYERMDLHERKSKVV